MRALTTVGGHNSTNRKLSSLVGAGRSYTLPLMSIEGLVLQGPVGPPLGDVQRTNLGGYIVVPPPPPPPPALCDADQLADLQDEYLADDLDLDLDLMTQWTEAQARSFFESGGATVPTLPPVYADLPALLREAHLDALEAIVSRDSLDLWLERFHHPDGRSAVLHRLKRLGVSKVGERQAIFNTFQRAWREGRLRPPAPQLSPLDSPTELLRQAAAHVTGLRAIPPDERLQRLEELGLDEEAVELVAGAASSVEVVKQLSAPQLGHAMESLGMSLASGASYHRSTHRRVVGTLAKPAGGPSQHSHFASHVAHFRAFATGGWTLLLRFPRSSYSCARYGRAGPSDRYRGWLTIDRRLPRQCGFCLAPGHARRLTIPSAR